MTNLINKININSKPTTFLNYFNTLDRGINLGSSQWNNVFTEQWGAVRTHWMESTDFYGLRFPVPWESLTTTPMTLILGHPRFTYSKTGENIYTAFANSSSGNSFARYDQNISGGWPNINTGFVFGVLNDYGLLRVSFTSSALTSSSWTYFGWVKDPQFNTGSPQFPRNLIWCAGNTSGLTYAKRITTENTEIVNAQAGTNIERTTDALMNPTIDCVITTSGANSTDVLIRDDDSPNSYIGKMWHTIRLPSAAIVGKIYKNTGADPDTGSIETDQKAFWLCFGAMGTAKLGMRVWTENII
jgi:hypothetical protein